MTRQDARFIPSIDQLRQRAPVRTLEARYGRAATVEALREEAAALRQRLAGGEPGSEARASIVDTEQAADQIERGLEHRLRHAFERPLRPVINATGVIVHTNLGRAPLAASAARGSQRSPKGTRTSSTTWTKVAGVHAMSMLKHSSVA